MKWYYIETKRRGTSYTSKKEGRLNWIGHVLRRNCFLKHVVEGKRE
jgi:hypothetical protein